MRCCWAPTVGCVFITIPIVICPLGRRTIVFWRARVSSPRPGRRAGLCHRPRCFGWRLPPSLLWRRRRHPHRRTTSACSQLDSQQWLSGAMWTTCYPSPTCPLWRNTLSPPSDRSLTLVGVANLVPGDIFGVAHAPLMCVPLDTLQHDSRAPVLSSGPPAMTLIAAVTASPLAAVVARPRPRLPCSSV